MLANQSTLSPSQSEMNRLHDAAHTEAATLRSQAIADFWTAAANCLQAKAQTTMTLLGLPGASAAHRRRAAAAPRSRCAA